MSKQQRKVSKLRPYRVDYFLHEEMLKDKALVRSTVVRAVTAKEAHDRLAGVVGGGRPYTAIRAYRFYKKLSAEPKKKTYIEIDKLLPAKKTIEVMTKIENRRPTGWSMLKVLEVEGTSFTMEEAGKKVDPTTLPPDHPDHECTDSCYGFKVIEGPISKVAEKLRQMSDTSNVAAGQPSPYTFPDKPLVPTKDATFDDTEALPVPTPPTPLYGPDFYPSKAVSLGSINLDEAAPVIHPAPEYNVQSMEALHKILIAPNPDQQGFYDGVDDLPEPPSVMAAGDVWDECVGATVPSYTSEAGQGVDYVSPSEANGSSKAPLITIGAVIIILGLLVTYFKWFVQ